MTNKKPIHTVPSGNGWSNKQGGKEISHHNNKANAEIAGRQQAKQSHTEHVIHNKNGQIGEKNSYGGDPCPPKDKR
ncbi:DUF2188 domain-containing protein [bacterium]|nr:DUF2188 domain-containing protein [bacterium]